MRCHQSTPPILSPPSASSSPNVVIAQVVLVTGCFTGIGRELHARGHRVDASARKSRYHLAYGGIRRRANVLQDDPMLAERFSEWLRIVPGSAFMNDRQLRGCAPHMPR